MEREAFLARIRAATGGGSPEGPSPAAAEVLPHDPAALVHRLAERWPRPQAVWHRTRAEDAGPTIGRVLRERGARLVALSRHPLVAQLGIAEILRKMGFGIVYPESQEDVHSVLATADAGITVAAHVVVETGTLVERASPEQPRSLSLLAPVHIALARESDLLDTLDDFFAVLDPGRPESAVTLISGPSGSADIGLQHVAGVHGPREIHLVLVQEERPAPQD